jgi:phosphoribosylamine--glycine ligase
MRVLTVGGGAREHAIAAALKRSGATLYSCMKNRNPGIARLCEEFALVNETDIAPIVRYAKARNVELAVIGPEAPLEVGLADALRKEGIAVVGPSKLAGMIETSKEFMRDLMEKKKLPGRVRYLSTRSMDEVNDWLDRFGADVVVKPSGLTGGKGAKIFGEHLMSIEEVKRYCQEIIDGKVDSSRTVILEERLEGEEFTIQAFVDGRNVIPMPAVQDHKRAYEGDRGPNTGGMGSYSDRDHLLPFLTKEDYDTGVSIIRQVCDALREEGREYRGILYGQFMCTKDGPKVVEFNARFGDPEAMNVLTIMTDSFLEVAEGVATGSLSRNCSFAPQATVCKYVVPEGYGTKPLAGQRIELDEEKIRRTGATLYYAAVNETEDGILTTTSRSIGIVGVGNSIESAEAICESALSFVRGRVFARHDIGKRELIMRRIEHMERLRGVSIARS